MTQGRPCGDHGGTWSWTARTGTGESSPSFPWATADFGPSPPAPLSPEGWEGPRTTPHADCHLPGAGRRGRVWGWSRGHPCCPSGSTDGCVAVPVPLPPPQVPAAQVQEGRVPGLLGLQGEWDSGQTPGACGWLTSLVFRNLLCFCQAKNRVCHLNCRQLHPWFCSWWGQVGALKDCSSLVD